MFAGRYKFWLLLGFLGVLFFGIVVAAIYVGDRLTRLRPTSVEHAGRTYEFWIESEETALFACGRSAGSPPVEFRQPFAQMRSPDDRFAARIRYVPEITTVHFIFRAQSYSYRLGDEVSQTK